MKNLPLILLLIGMALLITGGIYDLVDSRKAEPVHYPLDEQFLSNKGALRPGSSVSLWVDPTNRCHYFVAETLRGGIHMTPRLNQAGQQEGCIS